MSTIAESLVFQLEQAGVKRIYGLIGDSLNLIGNAVSKSNINWVSVRNEEIAAFAASAEGSATGVLSVCAGTSGPGSIHLINGLYEAKSNNSPVLALVSHIPISQTGLGYFQDYNPHLAFADCSVYCQTLSDTKQLPILLQIAMQHAISLRGPAVIIIPSDIPAQEYSEKPSFSPIHQTPSLVPEEEIIHNVAQVINKHSKVTIHCGIGASKGFDKLKTLAQKLQAPMLWTLRSKDFVEPENELAIGALGHVGIPNTAVALTNCDCLILAGTDFPFVLGDLPNKPTVIQFDNTPTHIGRRRPVEHAIIGDIDIIAEKLLDLVSPKDTSFLATVIDSKEKANASFEDKLSELKTVYNLRPECLTRAISNLCDENTTFIIDVGLNDIWANRYIKVKKGQKLVGSFKHGTMGAGLGTAIGLGFCQPERNLVYLAGDGNLSMVLGDLMTIERYNLPVKIVVYNNNTLGYIDLEAKIEQLPPFGTDLPNPHFADIASAMRIKSYKILKNSEAKSVLAEAFAEKGPVLIGCLTDKNAIAWED